MRHSATDKCVFTIVFVWGRSTGLPLPRRVADQTPTEPGAVPAFQVLRSRRGHLPIYTDFRAGGSRKVTIVRKIAGDVQALGYELERVCESPVTQFHGRLEVKGLHREKVKEWLWSLGF